MRTAVILAAGHGKKLWPYAEIRSKCLMPVSNRPLIDYSVSTLTQMGFENIVIVAGPHIAEIRNYYRKAPNVSIVEDTSPKGTAFSVACAEKEVRENRFLVLYGDTIIRPEDIERLIQDFSDGSRVSLLAVPISKDSGASIGFSLRDGHVENILGHPRESITHKAVGFVMERSFFEVLKANSGRFTETQVGMMSPLEGYIEMSLHDEIMSGGTVNAIEAHAEVFDIDKPWDILIANRSINTTRCAELRANILEDGASIDPSAQIQGFVHLGKGSRIGKNVTVNGSLIVGDNTIIDNGVIINDCCVIGDNCSLTNYCYLESFCTVGDDCVINHCAELNGMILRRVYLYHYMEFYGIIGENTDLGAATVCGTLRFDDNITIHRIHTRKEVAPDYGDATYLGDYCRTGVNAILMPGVKVGVYSIVGPGVLLGHDLPNNTLISVKQTLSEKAWDYTKYGW